MWTGKLEKAKTVIIPSEAELPPFHANAGFPVPDKRSIPCWSVGWSVCLSVGRSICLSLSLSLSLSFLCLSSSSRQIDFDMLARGQSPQLGVHALQLLRVYINL